MAVQKVDNGAINIEGHALAETTSAKHDLSF
jgi:hypothetical protein